MEVIKGTVSITHNYYHGETLILRNLDSNTGVPLDQYFEKYDKKRVKIIILDLDDPNDNAVNVVRLYVGRVAYNQKGLCTREMIIEAANLPNAEYIFNSFVEVTIPNKDSIVYQNVTAISADIAVY